MSKPKVRVLMPSVPLVMYQGENRIVVGEANISDNGTDLVVSAKLYPEHLKTVLGPHTDHFSIVPEKDILNEVDDCLDYAGHVFQRKTPPKPRITTDFDCCTTTTKH